MFYKVEKSECNVTKCEFHTRRFSEILLRGKEYINLVLEVGYEDFFPDNLDSNAESREKPVVLGSCNEQSPGRPSL